MPAVSHTPKRAWSENIHQSYFLPFYSSGPRASLAIAGQTTRSLPLSTFPLISSPPPSPLPACAHPQVGRRPSRAGRLRV
eukprot:scaffold264760_cov30-Tisochrysis_lutea.AAC.3